MRLEAPQLLTHCLPPPAELSVLEEAFHRRYNEIDEFLAAKEFEFSSIWPIPSLVSTELPLALELNIELDIMSDREFATALNTGIVRPIFARIGTLSSGQESRTCLRHRYKLAKVVDDRQRETGKAAAERDKLEDRLQQIKSSFEESSTLALPEPILTLGRFNIVSDGYWNPMSQGVSFGEFTIPRHVRFGTVEMNSEQATALLNMWSEVRKPGLLQRQKGLALALRRLSYQAQRERAEDELLDIMIAAEALYLSDLRNEPYRGELRYRLALRAALLADSSTAILSQREIFGLVKSAYDVRSAIAHGGTADPRILKMRGSRVPLKELVAATRNVLSAGCRTALALAGSDEGWPPDWDALTFPQP